MKNLLFGRFIFCTVIFFLSTPLIGQNIDFSKESSLGNLFIRMYGELHYYQPVKTNTYSSGTIDAKRVVALFGYQFNRNTQFVSEIEFEHANEVFLEQAFIKHKFASNTSLKAGMLLIPMGIVNESHEPNNYYSVDRPYIDRNLVPSTWRDIGIGLNGIFPASDIKYQFYLVNGLIGYKDGSAKFKQENHFRSGRQKGIKAKLSGLPAVSMQVEYFGFKNGKIGFSLYHGESNTDARDGLEKSDDLGVRMADSTTVQSTMMGLHALFSESKWSVKGQLIYSLNGGVNEYNTFGKTDLGKSALGMYIEGGHTISKNQKWLAFVRYANINPSLSSVEGNEKAGFRHIFTTGLNYNPATGAVFKLDGQMTALDGEKLFQINAGIGFWF